MASSNERAAAPFSLHCTICFDEFNLTDKPPVVLPCGHTYLCEPCSKRLKSCMECRKPLFIVAPKPVSPAAAYRHQNKPRCNNSPTSSPVGSNCTTRKSPTFASKGPPPRQELISLPIPKNLVLIALLEAAQQTGMAEKRQDDGYESGDDDEQVVAGMNLLSSDFGTYVVREKDGLVVLPLSPSPSFDEKVQASADDSPAAPPVDTFVNDRPDADFESFDLQDPVGVHVISSRASSSLEAPSFDEKPKDKRPVFRKAESTEVRDLKPFILRYGQTVQVVSFVDGVATLSRRNGFIEASSRQLVKSKCFLVCYNCARDGNSLISHSTPFRY